MQDPKAWQAIVNQQLHPDFTRTVWVLKQHYPTWLDIQRRHPDNYYLTSLMRSLYRLAVAPGGRKAAPQRLKLEGAEIIYTIAPNADVYVHLLTINEAISTFPLDQTTGLYRVRAPQREDDKDWKTLNKRQTVMSFKHQWGNAHYAVVSGKYKSKEAAGEILIDHITKAYKAAINEQDIQKPGNHYSLFWQQGGYHSRTSQEALLSLIQQAQQENARVNWLVQGEGAGTFIKALQALVDMPGVHAQLAPQENGTRQHVFFTNPRGPHTSQKVLQATCEKAGLSYVGTKINPTDLRNEDARHGAQAEAAKLVANLSVKDPLAVVGMVSLYKSLELGTTTSNLMAATGFGVAAYVIAKDVYTKVSGYVRHIPGAMSSTFGNGNQRWHD